MTREYIASANTVEEAFEIACRELGVNPDEVASREVLKLPKKGLFGKIKQQAEVKVTVEDEHQAVKSEKKPAESFEKKTPAANAVHAASAAPAVNAAPASNAKQVKSLKPAETSKPVKIESAVKSADPEKSVQSAPAAEKRKELQEKAGSAVSSENKAEEGAAELTEEELADIEPKIEIARAYLSEIFEKMGANDIKMEFVKAPDRTVIVHLDGDSIGTVIGKRGETLDSLQYLVCLVANRLRRREGDYVRFTMNAGNYREKREETLRALASRMARKALKTGRPVALEPMNPYERRIIHAVITDIEGVTSKSTGEEPNRKVVIKPLRTEGQGRDYRDGRGDGRRRDRYDRGPRRERGERSRRDYRSRDNSENPYSEGNNHENENVSAQPEKETVRREAVKLDDSVKLYGKIEL